jgi:HAD superfamily hydrolase (TIGR01509 family)
VTTSGADASSLPIPVQIPVPYGDIDTVFLDVGNTLISIDFDWVARELTTRNHQCVGDALRRAEAKARPAYADRIFNNGIPEGSDLFRTYLAAMLEEVDICSCLPRDQFDSLVLDLRQVLRPAGAGASMLWRSVMPRVPETLARLKAMGKKLVIVSNSDGTVERSLVEAGLRPFFDVVVDSAIAGYEKPDPRIFAYALEASGAARERTLHVGDIYHADVTGARGAGVHVVMLDPYNDWSKIEDVARVPDVWAVADLLELGRN